MPGCLVEADQKELNMQHAVHNRATIRVADRTDVSGRVTADEVTLERFHNRIRMVCASVAATSKVYLSAATMILIVTLVVPASAQKQVSFSGAIQGHERGITNLSTQTQSSFGTVTGIVTNLGQISLTYELMITLGNGQGNGFGVLLIGKNGDSIFATTSGTFHLPASGSPITVPSVTETYLITGGTGRFTGATGQFMVERLIDFVDAKMDFVFTAGVIINGNISFSNAENDNAQ
jgi:hypothetical protein